MSRPTNVFARFFIGRNHSLAEKLQVKADRVIMFGLGLSMTGAIEGCIGAGQVYTREILTMSSALAVEKSMAVLGATAVIVAGMVIAEGGMRLKALADLQKAEIGARPNNQSLLMLQSS